MMARMILWVPAGYQHHPRTEAMMIQDYSDPVTSLQIHLSEIEWLLHEIGLSQTQWFDNEGQVILKGIVQMVGCSVQVWRQSTQK